MATQQTQRRPWWKFPGYWAALAGAIHGFIGYGFILYGWTPFVSIMRQELGWSRAELGAAVSVRNYVRGPAAPAGGWVTDKWGPRIAGLITSTLMAVGWFAVSRVDSVLMLVLTYGVLMALGYNAGMYRVSWTAVNRWFIRYRARGIGLIAFGTGFGSAILVPTVALLLAAVGWQTTAVGIGVIFVIFGIGISFLFVPKMPEAYGMLPDNETPQEREERLARLAQMPAPARRRQAGLLADLSTREVLRTSAFWVLTLAGFGTAFAGVQSTFQNLRLVEMGISVEEAAVWYGMNLGLTMLGRATVTIVGDFLTQKFGPQNVLAFCYLMRAVGICFFALALNIWFVVIWVVLEGYFNGMAIPLFGNIFGDYFGRQAYGLVFGLRSGIIAVVSGSVPLLAGWIADTTGSWVLPFGIAAGGVLFGAICVAFTRPPKQQQALDQARGGQ